MSGDRPNSGTSDYSEGTHPIFAHDDPRMSLRDDEDYGAVRRVLKVCLFILVIFPRFTLISLPCSGGKRVSRSHHDRVRPCRPAPMSTSLCLCIVFTTVVTVVASSNSIKIPSPILVYLGQYCPPASGSPARISCHSFPPVHCSLSDVYYYLFIDISYFPPH
jgi:hypothetical protein